MNVVSFHFTYFWLLFLFIGTSQSNDKAKPCTYASKKKPIGYYSYTLGYANERPYVSYKIDRKDNCNEKCRVNDECWATSYNGKDNCSFYSTNHLNIHPNDNGLEYSQWTTCDMSDGQQPEDGRCRGLWIAYIGQYVSINLYSKLANITSTVDICKETCLRNSFCGFVNFREPSHCILIPKWPFKNLNNTFNQSTAYVWTCVDKFVHQITVSDRRWKPIDEKCTGYWTISSRDRRVIGQNISGLFFQTQIYTECLDECNQYANCRIALYNVTYSICVLIGLSETITGLPEEETSFIVFEWQCVKNDSHTSEMNEDEKRFVSLGMKCYRIENNNHLFIGKDQCGRCPLSSSFVSCYELSNTNYIRWDIRESCLVNQTYWTFPAKVVHMNISGNGWMNLTKMYTGIQQYWLAYSAYNILREVDFKVCRSFYASKPIEKLKNKEIITRSQWNAQPTIGNMRLFEIIPNYIDVSASQKPFHSCKTRAACSDILRTLQIIYFHGQGESEYYYDIPYNFMIDENGNIYEGRGWEYKCGDVGKDINSRTLCIAYIGEFKYELPNERFLNSLKKLIEYSVDKGHVDKNYTVFIHQDLASGEVNRNLVIVIKNWYRYRGFIPEDCTNYSLLIVYLPTITILFTCLWLYKFYLMNGFKMFCSKCKFFDAGNIIIRKIRLFERDLDLLDSEIGRTNHNNYCIIHQKSSLLSRTNLLQVVKLIKLWFFNQFLETINSRHHQNTLNNYLSSFPNIKDESLIYEIYVVTEDDVPRCRNIILCVKNVAGLRLFKRLVKARCCICYYFNLDNVDSKTIATFHSFIE